MPTVPLRVGIDARAAAEVPAGRGRYVRELLRALHANEMQVSPLLFARRAWPLEGSKWRLIPTREPFWGAHAGLVAAPHCDVILASNSYLMAIAPRPVVVVVQDVFGFDRSHGLPVSALGERVTLPLAVHRAAGFVCPSVATRDALERLYPNTRGRTVVIPLGVTPMFLNAETSGVARVHGAKRPFVLAVATLEPRKNLARLVEAFASSSAAREGSAELVLAGARGWSTSELDSIVGRHRDVVRPIGFVPESELPALYAEATAFAFPSLEEGFGLPVLEAMAAGTAVLTSNRSSLPEVAGDAALLVDPYDTGAIAAGLDRLLTDPALREDLAGRGRERAAGFTWERTAGATLDYLRSVTSTFAAGNRREIAVSS
jgi:glycosyltransferase involved in cell wall biosynthesis